VPEYVRNAVDAGVTRMVVIGSNLDDSRRAVDLADAYPGTLFAAVGVHPHDAETWDSEAKEVVSALAGRPGVVAIGEIGLDFYRLLSPRDRQIAAFEDQLELAAALDLPVVVHCRDAYDETLGMLERSEVRRHGGVLHCWSGSATDAQRTAGLGMMLGFGGIVTYDSARNVRDSLCSVPLENVVLETDSPYLAPVPFRGKRNEPAHTRIIAEAVAGLRGIGLEQLASITTANACRFYRLP